MINYISTQTSGADFAGDCVLAIVDNNHNNADLTSVMAALNFEQTPNNTLHLFNPDGFCAKQLMIVSAGENPSEKQRLTALVHAMKLVKKSNIKTLWLDCAANIQNLVAEVENSFYQFHAPYHSKDHKKPITLTQIELFSTDSGSIKNGLAIAGGMALCRELGDLPSNVCTPNYLAKVATDMAKDHQLDCEILDTQAMQDLEMGSLLSVAKGSVEPPKLITLHYKGAGDDQPIVLIGKGVTFDSGGISLKPGTAMDEMKYDMCGGASVLGVMLATALLKPKINLTVIVPSVENMPSSRASKPGDVVTSMSGQTIEILNTDAEGRLILCDAITYSQKFKPQSVIDVATLTGAMIVALGRTHTGVMGNNQALIDALSQAGENTQDTVWQFPLGQEYDDLLKSNFADMANIGNREAGSITAGCFLGRFAKELNWAHLDIAGTAWNTGANKGATGRPVALLTQYVLNQAGSGEEKNP